VLFQLLIVVVEITEFLWQDVGVRGQVKDMLAKLLLHPDYVVTHAVLPGDLIGLRKLVDLLIIIQAFVLV
jgi:hypothetical protein